MKHKCEDCGREFEHEKKIVRYCLNCTTKRILDYREKEEIVYKMLEDNPKLMDSLYNLRDRVSEILNVLEIITP